jgi:hypothetical protein
MSISSQLPLARIQKHLHEHLFNPFGATSEAKPVIHPAVSTLAHQDPQIQGPAACATQLTRNTPYLTVLARPSDSRLHVELWLRKTRYLDPHTQNICKDICILEIPHSTDVMPRPRNERIQGTRDSATIFSDTGARGHQAERLLGGHHLAGQDSRATNCSKAIRTSQTSTQHPSTQPALALLTNTDGLLVPGLSISQELRQAAPTRISKHPQWLQPNY